MKNLRRNTMMLGHCVGTSAIGLVLIACGGSDGGTRLLTSEEPAGVNCAEGGTRIDYGVDTNSDDSLNKGEIEETVYLCTTSDGEDGADGLDGENGVNGTIGANGLDGEDGSIGTNGINGTDGEDGLDGTNGTNGLDGTNGTNGLDGTNGTNGTDGEDGLDGTNGTNGLDGTNGEDGLDGTNGTDGEDGLDGTNGTNGTDGEDGLDGTNGINGLDGLDGTNGTDGEDGLDGTNGTNGTDGEDGLDGTNGTNGTDGEDGLDGTNGTNGTDGEDGLDGTNGTDGLSSLIAMTAEPRGAHCSQGGTRVDVGLDNGDGGGTAGDTTLQSGEIDDTAYICTPGPAPLVFLASSTGAVGFHMYTVSSDSWATMTSPPSTTNSQLTNDGTLVYQMGSDNNIYSYDHEIDTWADTGIDGPTAGVDSPIGLFVHFDDGFYYCKDDSTDLKVYRNTPATWATIALPEDCSSAGTWDAENAELYIRTFGEMGFMVIDTSTDLVARTITDATGVGENSRTGSYFEGNFYARGFSGPVQILDSISGAKTDSGQTPTSNHTSSDTDFGGALIYFGGYDGAGTDFQVYDVDAGTLTTLADHPAGTDHSTITVMR